ncbi:hypothetical protein L9F63_017623, partial [Diploptera punctata]
MEHGVYTENSNENHSTGIVQISKNVRRWIIKNYHKRRALFKTSWTFQTRQYFDNTTIHGVQYINEPNRPIFEKMMWFIFTGVGAFQNNPTLTSLDTDYHTWNVKFPAVTFCPITTLSPTRKVDQYRLKSNGWSTPGTQWT